ncbi:MAG: tyrosine-type recombinase/integrase [Pelagibacterium sp.]|uniref:tyrosine-type recombinase/integrase n=1 Tax=Pelagibacterium sp. TaxID=1967288 RepID=UPI0032EF57CB
MPKLTKTIVEGAELREKQYTIWDSELSGFGVYVHPTGRRSYFVDYTNKDGKRRRMTIGRHGVITAEQARKLAIETLGTVVLQKDDPLEEKRTRRKALTVAELCDQYMAAAKAGRIMGKGKRPKKPSTLEIDQGRIDRHIKPLLGGKKVIDLTRADIARFQDDVASGKTASKTRAGKNGARVEVKGGPGTASRTVGFLGGILTYAVRQGVIESNPARGVERPTDGTRTRRLTPEEYGALGKALLASEDAFETPQALTGVYLLALTGCRLGEIVNLQHTEVDAAAGCFRLEDSKEGATVRPIGRAAFDIIEKAERFGDNPNVLPGQRRNAPYRGLAGALPRIMERAGLEDVTAHTLRHSFASVAGDLGYADGTIAALLGHAAGTVTSRYVHRLDTVMVAAANKVSSEIWRQMTGAEAKVLEMPRRA